MLLKEVGLECEWWLLDYNNKIVEAPKYNFPSDSIGFLVETSGIWSNCSHVSVDTLIANKVACMEKASELGFYMTEYPWMPVTNSWKDYIIRKYDVKQSRDNTFNIYRKGDTQHTGFRYGKMKNIDGTDYEGWYATAGLHVHFSIWDTDSEAYVWMNVACIENIVKQMDNIYKKEITDYNRMMGEWEPKGFGDETDKPHGFEYRALPNNVNKYDVATNALDVLNNCTQDLP